MECKLEYGGMRWVCKLFIASTLLRKSCAIVDVKGVNNPGCLGFFEGVHWDVLLRQIVQIGVSKNEKAPNWSLDEGPSCDELVREAGPTSTTSQVPQLR